MEASPLEEERDFLLRSLEDLERERAVGDVDEHDYVTLKDEYTVRAAMVLRELEAGLDRPATTQARRSLNRTLLIALGVLGFAGLAGLLVTQALGRRESVGIAPPTTVSLICF